ncbi:putative ligase domain protein [Mycobacterium xenopi 3993]|nr:putative ligase domain protein [Mycobacterium xenopi 3993]
MRGRCDFDGRTCEHRDSVAMTDAGRSQAAGHTAGALVHLVPAVPHRA